VRRGSSGESKTVTLKEEEGRKATLAKPHSLASRDAKPVNKVLKDGRKKTL